MALEAERRRLGGKGGRQRCLDDKAQRKPDTESRTLCASEGLSQHSRRAAFSKYRGGAGHQPDFG